MDDTERTQLHAAIQSAAMQMQNDAAAAGFQIGHLTISQITHSTHHTDWHHAPDGTTAEATTPITTPLHASATLTVTPVQEHDTTADTPD